MALQTSGLIDASDINNELGVATNSQFSLNSSTARLLAGITSGTIKFSDFYGKSSALTKMIPKCDKVKDMNMWKIYDSTVGNRTIKGPDKPGSYSILDLYENYLEQFQSYISAMLKLC